MPPWLPPPNRPQLLARAFWGCGAGAALLATLPFLEGHPLSGAWALAFLALFAGAASVTLALIFQKRARRMAALLRPEALLARWELDDAMLEAYVALLRADGAGRGRVLLAVLGVLFTGVTLVLLVPMEAEDRPGFVLAMGAILGLIYGASRLFPWCHLRRQLRGDRQVLVGYRGLYVNGSFHDWSSPGSRLTKATFLKKPFQGLHLVYQVRDRARRYGQALKIPTPPGLEVPRLVAQLRAGPPEGGAAPWEPPSHP